MDTSDLLRMCDPNRPVKVRRSRTRKGAKAGEGVFQGGSSRPNLNLRELESRNYTSQFLSFCFLPHYSVFGCRMDVQKERRGTFPGSLSSSFWFHRQSSEGNRNEL